jgi:HPt (histidine-containing phosphotransfer) domain-containing protein
MGRIHPTSEGPITAMITERPLDLVHLARQTLGDRDLECEVLRLFAVQSASMMQRLGALPAEEKRLVAHTLKGSARAIGAWRVASAAATIEEAAEADLAVLNEAVREANAMIGDLTRAA